VFLPISPYATNENAGGVEKWRILKTLAAAFNKSKKNFFRFVACSGGGLSRCGLKISV
jgi:hypothetical protein